jgi:hypothetical protein
MKTVVDNEYISRSNWSTQALSTLLDSILYLCYLRLKVLLACIILLQQDKSSITTRQKTLS